MTRKEAEERLLFAEYRGTTLRYGFATPTTRIIEEVPSFHDMPTVVDGKPR